MDHKTLLEALGGPHEVHRALVARGLKLQPVSVRAWLLPNRSIPAKYWVHLVEIAAEKGRRVLYSDLAREVKQDPARSTPTAEKAA